MELKGENHILVTGSDGFIGRRLVKTMRNSGITVEEFDRDKGDISTYQFSYPHLDHVVHLASLIFVPDSWKYPQSFYQTNLIGTVNILESCRKMNCSLTYISSYVYGAPKYLPVDESHPLHPSSPYNHSKLLAEEACRYYADIFNMPVTIFRPVNVFGPGQNPDFLIPKIISQVFDPNVETVEVMDLRPKRDFLYIDDFIQALIKSIEQSTFDIFNLGSGYSISVEDIIKTIIKISGINKPYSAKNEERKNEIWDVYANISKIKDRMGWIPTITFEEGIKKCIEAFKASV
jgi:nucleoside-diphosphate-sugar epimerase